MILYCTYVEIIITHLDPQNFDLEKTIIKNFNIFCGLPPTFQTDQTWSVKIIFSKKIHNDWFIFDILRPKNRAVFWCILMKKTADEEKCRETMALHGWTRNAKIVVCRFDHRKWVEMRISTGVFGMSKVETTWI